MLAAEPTKSAWRHCISEKFVIYTVKMTSWETGCSIATFVGCQRKELLGSLETRKTSAQISDGEWVCWRLQAAWRWGGDKQSVFPGRYLFLSLWAQSESPGERLPCVVYFLLSKKNVLHRDTNQSLFFFFFWQVTKGRKLLTPVPWGCAEHKSQVSGGCHPLPSTPKVSPWSTEAVEMLLHCLALHSVQPRTSPPALSLLGGKHLLGVLPMPTFVLSQLLVTQHTLTHMLLFASWEKTFWIF